jgi:hypothetical protein
MRMRLGLLAMLSLVPFRSSAAQAGLHPDPVALNAVLPPSASPAPLSVPISVALDSVRHHGVGHAALVGLGIGTAAGLLAAVLISSSCEENSSSCAIGFLAIGAGAGLVGGTVVGLASQ